MGIFAPEVKIQGVYVLDVAALKQSVRSYELTNHLGNVLSTITDKGVITSAQDYYPFGLTLASRSFTEGGSAYRYSFNGKEDDKGLGTIDFGDRMYRKDLGRWSSVDFLAVKYSAFSPYNFCLNNPLYFIDPDGNDVVPSADFKKTRAYAIFQTLQSNQISATIKKFEGKILHLSLSNNMYSPLVTTLGQTAPAGFETSKQQLKEGNGYIKSNKYTINISIRNSYQKDASDISIASVLIHELYHAQVYYDMETHKQGSGSSIEDYNNDKFPSYKKFYNEMKEQNSLSDNVTDFHHEFMALYRRKPMIEELKKFDKATYGDTDRSGNIVVNNPTGIGLGKNVKYSSDDFYEALSWGGLQGTKAWEKFEKSNQEKASIYQAILDLHNGSNPDKDRKKK